MLLSEFLGGSGVIPTISSWQELPLNFQYVEPMVVAICWSASTTQHPQSINITSQISIVQMCL
jgi:hypothetical protein